MSLSDLILDVWVCKAFFSQEFYISSALRLACLKQGLKACRFVTRKHVDSEPWWGTGNRHTTLAFVIGHIPTKFKVGWSSWAIDFLIKCLASVNDQLVVYSSMYSIVYWFNRHICSNYLFPVGWEKTHPGLTTQQFEVDTQMIYPCTSWTTVHQSASRKKTNHPLPRWKLKIISSARWSEKEAPGVVVWKCFKMIYFGGPFFWKKRVVLFSWTKKTSHIINMVDFGIVGCSQRCQTSSELKNLKDAKMVTWRKKGDNQKKLGEVGDVLLKVVGRDEMFTIYQTFYPSPESVTNIPLKKSTEDDFLFSRLVEYAWMGSSFIFS